ncbi:MAG: cbb3-type cytochrome c oxidase subunit I [Bacteroidota bacterium]
MEGVGTASGRLSPWWRNGVIIVLVVGFSILIWLATRAYDDAPPIPDKVLTKSGEIVFSKAEILAGQQVFLKYALMENGTVWGHGAYLGPDFSAEYLHALSTDMRDSVAQQRYNRGYNALTEIERGTVDSEVKRVLKQNRYDAKSRTLQFTGPEVASFDKQVATWAEYFSQPDNNGGLPVKYISDTLELKHLVAFFAWTAWASVVERPGKPYSYTNNFPYDTTVGNTPSMEAVLWSALSLIALLAATGLVLFVVGRFDFLGWKGKASHVHPQMLPGLTTESQKATIKFFVLAVLLFLGQVLVGGGTAHFRADPHGFYGLDLAPLFSSQILRTWHLQLAIFWIATAYVAGGLLLAPALGGSISPRQVAGVNFLFVALTVVVFGSLLGEILGVNQTLGKLWFWFGHQGWEYLDLGRAWQILLVIGFLVWVVLLFRGVSRRNQDEETRSVSSLFLYAAVAIPLFYLPAMFFKDTTHFSVVDTWRFWIIHLWVEGFFELFATVMVAVMFYKLGIISHITASRVVYLDAILYLGSGIIGTGHHWYWTGQSTVTMALSAVFSAMEVVPLTLLTLDAWDFIKLTKGTCDICGKKISIPHKWTFYFLMSVGFWNFVGAGIFGFLINLPIVSYFEVGTILTPNHGHAAMMGVFGMLAIALIVFALRQVLADQQWTRVERYVRVSFWGLNIGLALMVLTNLLPGGVLQLIDVLRNGYWHARSMEFLQQPAMRMIEWLRLPGDLIFIGLGAVPMLLAAGLTYGFVKRGPSS